MKKYNKSTKLKFAFLPKVCHKSRKKIWLEYAYCVKVVDVTFGWVTIEIDTKYWFTKEEYLIAKIKGHLQ